MPGPIIAIVGLGSAGRRHFRNLLTLVPDAKFVLVTKQRTLPVDYAGADVYFANSLIEACSMRPDMAIIANETAKHVETGMAFVRNSETHLYIEKPLSHNKYDSDMHKLISISHDLTTMVGYQYRFHPRLLELKQRLSVCEFGQVVSVRAEWGEYLPGWHPGEDHRRSYAADADSGGVILTLSHCVDYLRWLFGEVLDVRYFTCDVPELETPCQDDACEVLLQFSRVIGTVHLDYVQPQTHAMTIVGTKKTERIDLVLNEADRNSMFLAEMREFLSAVDERRPSSIPLSEGLATLKVCADAQ